MPKSRQETPPHVVRSLGWILAFFAVVAAVGAVWSAVADANDHADVLRFDAAPVCEAPGLAAATSDCKAELPATLVSVTLTRGKAPLAILDLRTSDNTRTVAYVDPDRAPDAGEHADVVLWRGRCVIVRTDGEGDIPTRDNPGTSQSELALLVVGLSGVTVLSESFSAASFLYFMVDRERAVAAHLMALVPLVVTFGLRVAHDYDAVIVASIAVPVLVLGLWVVWPRLAWARKQEPAPAQEPTLAQDH